MGCLAILCTIIILKIVIWILHDSVSHVVALEIGIMIATIVDHEYLAGAKYKTLNKQKNKMLA